MPLNLNFPKARVPFECWDFYFHRKTPLAVWKAGDLCCLFEKRFNMEPSGDGCEISFQKIGYKTTDYISVSNNCEPVGRIYGTKEHTMRWFLMKMI